jgi:alpha-L-arabinofuranosidase
LPVIAAGVPCQNSGLLTGVCGQGGGIPMNKMDEYVQDILDLIEWANGPANSKWGKIRAEAGHPAPFNLTYIGIGNEDLISDVFEERFTMIYKAIRQKHPEITVIGTTGPFHDGTDYGQGWALATQLQVPLVDEHYYEQPGWFINNQDYYDHYDRNKPKVYLGEYASHGNTLYNALAEALYLTNVERNGDVVRMTSYAPLLAKEKYTQWNPDLIYFNNTGVKPTVNYEVQKLFGNNAGNEYLPSVIKLSNEDEAVRKRFGISVVRNTNDGSVVIKLVNLLPVATSLKLELGELTAGSKADRSVLQGQPGDKLLPVTVTATSVDNILEETLAPYSLTVWRIHK